MSYWIGRMERAPEPREVGDREGGVRDHRPRRRRRVGDGDDQVLVAHGVEVEPVAAAERRAPVPEHVPGEAQPGRDVLPGRVLVERADRHLGSEEVGHVHVPVPLVAGQRGVLVAQPGVEGQPLGEADLVLHVEAEEGVRPRALEVPLGGEADEAERAAAQEALEVGEGVDAAAEGRVVLVGLVALDQDAGLERVPPAGVEEVAVEGEDVLPDRHVGGDLRPEPRDAPDVDRPERLPPGHEGRERLGRVGLDLLADPRARVAEPEGPEGPGREHPPVLRGRELVPRHERPRELGEVGGQVLLGPVVACSGGTAGRARPGSGRAGPGSSPGRSSA